MLVHKNHIVEKMLAHRNHKVEEALKYLKRIEIHDYYIYKLEKTHNIKIKKNPQGEEDPQYQYPQDGQGGPAPCPVTVSSGSQVPKKIYDVTARSPEPSSNQNSPNSDNDSFPSILDYLSDGDFKESP